MSLFSSSSDSNTGRFLDWVEWIGDSSSLPNNQRVDSRDVDCKSYCD